MKKIVVLCIEFVMLLAIVSCGNNEGVNKQQASVKNRNNIAVVYFSHGGNTEFVAKAIQNITGADLFKIETVNPYPIDATELGLKAEKELSENYIPALKKNIINVEKYDIIFIGYPIWRGTFPQVIFAFLKEYNLSGKTVIPFCTYGGSGLGNTVSKIRMMAPRANVVDGLAIKASSPDVERQVGDWISNLKLIADSI